MFMFRKRETIKSETEKVKLEAEKFQKSVEEIEKNFKQEDLNIEILKSYSEKTNIDLDFFKKTFKPILEKNAKREIKKVKEKGDYTIVDLEKVANNYGFNLDELNVSFY